MYSNMGQSLTVALRVGSVLKAETPDAFRVRFRVKGQDSAAVNRGQQQQG